MCIQDNPNYRELYALGYIYPNMDVCMEYPYEHPIYEKYPNLTKYWCAKLVSNESNNTFLKGFGVTPEEALDRLWIFVRKYHERIHQ